MKASRSVAALAAALSLALPSGGTARALALESVGRGASPMAPVSAAFAAGARNRVFGSTSLAMSMPLAALSSPFAAPSAPASAAAARPSVLQGAKGESPDFAKMSSGESSDAAERDFLRRIGGRARPEPAPVAADGPRAPDAAPGGPGSAEFVVVFAPGRKVTKDLHLSSGDSLSLRSELDVVGLGSEMLASYGASPVASYRRINAATIRVDASKADEFEAALRARGHRVFPNDRRQIIVPIVPDAGDPAARNPVSMAENLKITKADAVQRILRERFGDPDMNPWPRLKAALGFERPAQPAIAVLDSGADVGHPLLRRVKEVKNQTSGKNVDDIGHGSWVTSMVLHYAPWAANVTHYKAFLNGGATLDDILKALTAAANDGNLVISNSWGSDDGDPNSPDSLLVAKIASEGHVLVFAAGNAGPGKNTIGSPAIVQYKDPATGAIRVVAVAATDRDKKVASFSSRGPGSRKTAGKGGFAHRPDLAALGSNAEGAWPAALGDADRSDPQLGPLKAISGTSMSTPAVAGALALLMIAFGVTAKGAMLDAVVNAVLATVEKAGNGADAEGGGFLNVTAAYELLSRQLRSGGSEPRA